MAIYASEGTVSGPLVHFTMQKYYFFLTYANFLACFFQNMLFFNYPQAFSRCFAAIHSRRKSPRADSIGEGEGIKNTDLRIFSCVFEKKVVTLRRFME